MPLDAFTQGVMDRILGKPARYAVQQPPAQTAPVAAAPPVQPSQNIPLPPNASDPAHAPMLNRIIQGMQEAAGAQSGGQTYEQSGMTPGQYADASIQNTRNWLRDYQIAQGAAAAAANAPGTQTPSIVSPVLDAGANVATSAFDAASAAGDAMAGSPGGPGLVNVVKDAIFGTGGDGQPAAAASGQPPSPIGGPSWAGAYFDDNAKPAEPEVVAPINPKVDEYYAKRDAWQAAQVAYDANPTPENKAALDQAEADTKAAFYVFSSGGDTAGEFLGKLGTDALRGISVLDLPRQAHVSWAGDNMYDAAMGQGGRHVIDKAFNDAFGLNDWASDPKNQAEIISAYRDGYTGGGGEHFTGGRAVWEAYVSHQGGLKRAALDFIYDPLNYIPVAEGALKGVSAGVDAAEAANPVARAVGSMADAAAHGVGAANEGLALPFEGAIAGAKAIVGKIPGLSRALEASPKARVRSIVDSVRDAALHVIEATKKARDASETAAVPDIGNPAGAVGADAISGRPVPANGIAPAVANPNSLSPNEATNLPNYTSDVGGTVTPIQNQAKVAGNASVFTPENVGPTGSDAIQTAPVADVGAAPPVGTATKNNPHADLSPIMPDEQAAKTIIPSDTPTYKVRDPRDGQYYEFKTQAEANEFAAAVARETGATTQLPLDNAAPATTAAQDAGPTAPAQTAAEAAPAADNAATTTAAEAAPSTTTADLTPATAADAAPSVTDTTPTAPSLADAVAKAGSTPEVIPPMAVESVPKTKRDWTNPDYRSAVKADLEKKYDPAVVDRWTQAREESARLYRAKQDAIEAAGGTKDPLDHVRFVVEQNRIFARYFPDEPIPFHRFRNGPTLVLDSYHQGNMIEHAVFGTDEDATAARRWFHTHRENAIAAELKSLREEAMKAYESAGGVVQTAPETGSAKSHPNLFDQIAANEKAKADQAAAQAAPEPPQAPKVKPAFGQAPPPTIEDAAVDAAPSVQSGPSLFGDSLPPASSGGLFGDLAPAANAAPETPFRFEYVTPDGQTRVFHSQDELRAYFGLLTSEKAAAERRAARAAGPSTGGAMPSDITTTTLDNLKLDVDKYQMRHTTYSEEGVQKIIDGWDPRKLEAIQVVENGDGTFTVLGGHNRREAIRRLIEMGRVQADFAIPIKIVRGTEQEIRDIALTSNAKIALKPTENGRNLQMQLDNGKPWKQLLADNQFKDGEAKRYLALNELPQELKGHVDHGILSVKQGAELGEAIKAGTINKDEAASFFTNEMAGQGGLSDTELTHQLQTIAGMKRLNAEQAAGAGQANLFDMPGVGFDFSSDNMRAAMDRSRELLKETEQLKRSGNALAKAKEIGWDAEMKAKMEAKLSELQQKVNEAEQTLGRPLTTFKGKAKPVSRSDVGLLDYWSRVAETVKANRRLESERIVNAQKRARGLIETVPTDNLPIEPIINDAARAQLDETYKTLPGQIGKTYQHRLEEMIGKPLGSATPQEIEAVMPRFQREIRQDLQIPDPGKIGRFMDRAASAFSAFTLMPIWAMPRTVLSNTLLGNTVQVIIADMGRSLKTVYDPENVKALFKMAFKGEIPVNSPVFERAANYELGVPTKFFDQNSSGIISVTVPGSIQKAAGSARAGWVGSAGDLFATISGQKITRNLVNGVEWSFKTGLWGWNLDKFVREDIGAFVNQSVNHARLMAPHVPEAEIRAVFGELGHEFGPSQIKSDMERLARSHGVPVEKAKTFGDRVSRDWANYVKHASDRAVTEGVEKALFNFEQTNADAFLRRFVPFHMWMSRAIPFYVEQGLRHPGFAAAWYRMNQGIEHQAEAEGWPDSLKKYAKLWTGPGGMMLFFQPNSALQLMDAFIDSNGGYTPAHITKLGDILNQTQGYGISLLPWWSAILNYTGALGDAQLGLDPVGSYGARKVFGSVLQMAAAHGLMGSDYEKYLGRPFEESLQNLRQITTRFFGNEVKASDPGAYGQELINNIMLSNYLTETGMTEDQFRALGLAPYGSPEYQQYEDVMNLMLDEVNVNGDRHKEAVKEYADSGGAAVLAGAVATGGIKVRQESQMDRAAQANGSAPISSATRLVLPASDPYDDGIITASESEFLKLWRQTYNRPYEQGDIEKMRGVAKAERDLGKLTKEAYPVVVGQNQYYTLGTKADQAKLDYYWSIGFGDVHQPLFMKDGRSYSVEQIKALDQTSRFLLADAWLAETDKTGSVADLKTQRELFLKSHAEYGAYVNWRKDVRKSYDQNLQAYRIELVAANPGMKQWFIEKDRSLRESFKKTHGGREPNGTEKMALLDQATTSMDAYFAIKRIKRAAGDPSVNSNGADPRPAAAGGSGGFAAGLKIPYDQRIKNAMTAADAYFQQVNTYLSNRLGVRADYGASPPIIRQSLDVMLQEANIQKPKGFSLVEKYQRWASDMASRGLNYSVDAFIAATAAEDAAANPYLSVEP